MAGNVVTKEMTEALILSGVDVVKTGLGNGSCCKTRTVTGVGVPQVSAVSECANYAHGLNGHVISDGGCTCPGDVSKAFCCGADFVMLGTLLAGTDEGGGEIITRYRKKKYLESLDDSVYEEYKVINFYGMSSRKANDTFFGGMKEYRSSEGREIYIPYKGSINGVIREILGGVRSTCTYIGAKEIRNMSKCATFIRVNNQISKYVEKYEE
jgi:GMP reductase